MSQVFDPVAPNEAPRRKSSRLVTGNSRAPDDVEAAQAPPVRTKSMLDRLKIAALDIGTTDRPFTVEEMPPRSPTGAVRVPGGSVLVRRDKSKLVQEKAEKADEKGPQWHLLALPELYSALNTRAEGLTAHEAEVAQAKYGMNELTPPSRTPLIVKFLLNLVSPFSLIMLVCGTLAFAIVGYNTQTTGVLDKQNLALGIVLWGVAVLVGAFQTMMENNADNLMAALHDLTAEFAWVMRDGQLVQKPAKELVPGDIVRVQMGEKVPADLRVLSAQDLRVNNSSLTGENVDIKLGPDPCDTRLFEAKNIARSGCNFTNGNGLGIVFATGDETFFGKIAHSATAAEKPDTLMRREVKRLILMLAALGVIMAAAFFIAALVTGRGLIVAFVICVGLFTANVPEGLLPQITVALTIAARKMSDHKVVVSNLEIIETLGAVSVICSDKTGTLTLNRMTVTHFVLDGKMVMNQFSPLLPTDKVIQLDVNHPAYQALQRIICLNSDGVFIERDNADVFQWTVKGDASETALLKFAQSKTDVEAMRQQFPRLCVVPFHSKNKWMAAVHRIGPNKQLVMLKGAAERVIARCSTAMMEGAVVPLTPELRKHMEDEVMVLANRAERVFAFAQMELNMPDDFEFVVDGDVRNFPMEGFTLVGMASMVDPPRPSVPPAIKDCHKAGIHVIMVTGDHPATAVAISRSLGLITLPLLSEAGPNADPDKCAAVVTGDDIVKFTQSDWDRVLQCREHVFARTQPEQKQQLVWRLHERGHVVAMTGDGVNDAPALKAANVGVAVGSGTSVAKEAAQIIITDDDFGSIVLGVREGRQIFDNLKKAVTFIVAHLSPEVFPFVFNFALAIPLVLETITILLIDLGTDMLPGIALAWEEADARIMAIPPRTADDHMVQPRMLVWGYGVIGCFETFFAFWSAISTFYDKGFTVSDIMGIDQFYHDSWASQTDATYKQRFMDLCLKSPEWKNNCSDMPGFMSYLNGVVCKAVAAYFITFACMQYTNCLCRRSQTMSMFDPRQYINWRLIAAIIFSVCFMIFFVYVPTVNEAFFLAQVEPRNAIPGLWGIPVIIIIEEVRKFFCRRYPQGVVARWTIF